MRQASELESDDVGEIPKSLNGSPRPPTPPEAQGADVLQRGTVMRMANAIYEVGQATNRGAAAGWGAGLVDAARAAGPPLLFGLRLWASVCLALYVAFWLELDNAFWAGTSAAIVCQPQLGASLRKALVPDDRHRRRRRR